MATAAKTAHLEPDKFSLIQPGLRLFTAADVAALPGRLPSGSVSFELHHGRLVPMSPPGAAHGNLQNRIGAALYTQGEEKGLGKAFTRDGDCYLSREPDDLIGADAAFIQQSNRYHIGKLRGLSRNRTGAHR